MRADATSTTFAFRPASRSNRGRPYTTRATGTRRPCGSRVWSAGRGRFGDRRPPCRLSTAALAPHRQSRLERRNARDLPLVPHGVHHALDVVDVLVHEVREASLLLEVLVDRDAPLLPRVVRVDHLTVDALVERED